MTTLTAAPLTFAIDLELTAPAPGGKTIKALPVTFRMDVGLDSLQASSAAPEWTAAIVDQDGVRVCQLPIACVGPITERLNAAESVRLSVPINGDTACATTAAAICDEAHRFRSVIVWKNGRVKFRGRITDWNRKRSISAEANGPLWEFDRRVVGAAQTTNDLTNGSFARGFYGWQILRGNLIAGLYPGYITPDPGQFLATRAEGGPVVRLWGTGNTDQQFLFIAQNHTYTAPPDRPLPIVLVAEVKFASPIPIEHVFDDTLLLLARFPTSHSGFPLGYYTDPIEQSITTWQEQMPADTWIRLTCHIEIPPGQTQVVVARLGSTNGPKTYFRNARLRSQQAIYYRATDPSVIACGLIDHAQDTAYDKSDLGITTTALPTEFLVDREYNHEDHEVIGRATAQLCSDGYIDEWIVQTRTTRTYYAGPRKGSYKPSMRLVCVNGAGNCVPEDHAFAGSSAASSVIGQGVGSSFDRDEASAIDTGGFDGLVLEDVWVAPPEVTQADLPTATTEALVKRLHPETVKVTTRPGTAHDDALHIGDSTDVYLFDDQAGALIDGRMRVLEKETSPSRAGTVLYTLGWFDD